MPFHSYTTTVISTDGSFAAEVVSVPGYFPSGMAEDPLAALTSELNVVRAAPVTPDHLADMLTQLAYESPAARRAVPGDVTQVVLALANDPLVVIERSPSSGTSLTALLTQGTASVLVAEGRPFLALVYESGVVLVWFLGGPVQGIRDASREVAHEVWKEYLRRQIRRRFPSRRRGDR
jgi:hypothetical protein